MRKMKKINGYLVVKFNARELREYEGTALGEYGVIDAELYTGNLDVDRGAMEYDNAGSMEEAVELARGLESELDAEEPEVKVTIVKETDETTEEEEVDAQQMIAGWENVLRGQVASAHYIVEAAEGFIRLRSGTGLMAQSPFSSCRQQHQYHLPLTCFARMREPQEQRIRTQSLPWVTACPTLRFCISVCTWSKVFRGMMGGCVPTA